MSNPVTLSFRIDAITSLAGKEQIILRALPAGNGELTADPAPHGVLTLHADKGSPIATLLAKEGTLVALTLIPSA
jgi:hypothetical protein